jgi:hypothetical protein
MPRHADPNARDALSAAARVEFSRRMVEKPGLREWARSLQVLIREGSAPVESAAQRPVLASAAAGNEVAARMVNG